MHTAKYLCFLICSSPLLSPSHSRLDCIIQLYTLIKGVNNSPSHHSLETESWLTKVPKKQITQYKWPTHSLGCQASGLSCYILDNNFMYVLFLLKIMEKNHSILQLLGEPFIFVHFTSLFKFDLDFSLDLALTAFQLMTVAIRKSQTAPCGQEGI